jgi:hypothetical protein
MAIREAGGSGGVLYRGMLLGCDPIFCATADNSPCAVTLADREAMALSRSWSEATCSGPLSYGRAAGAPSPFNQSM